MKNLQIISDLTGKVTVFPYDHLLNIILQVLAKESRQETYLPAGQPLTGFHSIPPLVYNILHHTTLYCTILHTSCWYTRPWEDKML